MGERLSTGMEGLDEILDGGLIRDNCFLISGSAGTGKTIFGSFILSNASENGYNTLLINLDEDLKVTKKNFENFSLNEEDVNFSDLSPTGRFFEKSDMYQQFGETDGTEISSQLNKKIKESIEKHNPDLLLLDSATLIESLCGNKYRFRRMILSLISYIKNKEICTILTAQASTSQDNILDFLVDGAIKLRFQNDIRKLSVTKYRNSDFKPGWHTYTIQNDGLNVYPQISKKHSPNQSKNTYKDPTDSEYETLSFGIPELDKLTGGGIGKTTSTIITGSSGIGKTTLNTQLLTEAAQKGEKATIILLEEHPETLLQRTKQTNIPLKQMIEQNKITLKPILPHENQDLTADIFAHTIKKDIKENNTQNIMIDGINGYQHIIQEDKNLQQLIKLVNYLKTKNTTITLTNATKKLTGDLEITEKQVTNIADNIILLRYIATDGELKRTCAVIKKRTSDFEKTLREYKITKNGIKVGKPLKNLKGTLTGIPEKNR
ncbi:ATPase domain-containing protein [Methanonatronarchaeum sp. AMET6-2]|uniref:ATPase domain-containing protein n=1 Tax=Methanonatronarchaeum sp. AMET6-2 TaxID=2933293 RepID=UPI001FF47BDB|nr:ATPase domain-containing protein [Methanonatronarchaeum sp. AMET6-2]UOY10049.1 hypothetical protein MU439_07270 [Methanonatronarchaeum sp. AMET6-2]